MDARPARARAPRPCLRQAPLRFARRALSSVVLVAVFVHIRDGLPSWREDHRGRAPPQACALRSRPRSAARDATAGVRAPLEAALRRAGRHRRRARSARGCAPPRGVDPPNSSAGSCGGMPRPFRHAFGGASHHLGAGAAPRAVGVLTAAWRGSPRATGPVGDRWTDALAVERAVALVAALRAARAVGLVGRFSGLAGPLLAASRGRARRRRASSARAAARQAPVHDGPGLGLSRRLPRHELPGLLVRDGLRAPLLGSILLVGLPLEHLCRARRRRAPLQPGVPLRAVPRRPRVPPGRRPPALCRPAASDPGRRACARRRRRLRPRLGAHARPRGDGLGPRGTRGERPAEARTAPGCRRARQGHRTASAEPRGGGLAEAGDQGATQLVGRQPNRPVSYSRQVNPSAHAAVEQSGKQLASRPMVSPTMQ